MKTNKRLNQVYQSAKEIPFDENDRFIFFSDVHRGDNSMSDEFAHNQNIYAYALDTYYKQGYTYVELGDGDELWEHGKFKHIRGAHSDIFCILKDFYMDNRLLMVFGNHNMYLKNKHFVKTQMSLFYDEYLDRKSDLFPGLQVYEALKFVYKKNRQELLAVHGHQGDFMNDQMWRVSMISLRYFWRYMHIIGFHNPSSPAKNRIRRHKIEVNFSNWIRKNQKAIICGHTHRPKFPKRGELPYFNTGCCIHPRGITGIEIVNGEIMLIDWRIRPDDEGRLLISKKIIRGPEPIEQYNKIKNRKSLHKSMK